MLTITTPQPFAVVSRNTNSIDIVAVGTDSQIYHKAYDESGWQDWTSLGGNFAYEAPALVASSPNRLDLFGRDKTTKNLMRLAWNGAAWETEWHESDEQQFDRGFAAVSWEVGRVDVFGTANDRMYHRAVRFCVRRVETMRSELTSHSSSMAARSPTTEKIGTPLSSQIWLLHPGQKAASTCSVSGTTRECGRKRTIRQQEAGNSHRRIGKSRKFRMAPRVQRVALQATRQLLLGRLINFTFSLWARRGSGAILRCIECTATERGWITKTSVGPGPVH